MESIPRSLRRGYKRSGEQKPAVQIQNKRRSLNTNSDVAVNGSTHQVEAG